MRQKNSFKKVVVVKDFKNSSKQGESTETFEKFLVVTGTVSEGYLYIKADIDGHSLAMGYGDIYAKLIESATGIYREYGGHLIENQSLNTPKSDSHTELLYDLASVKYKRSFNDSNTEVLSGNWLEVLNNTHSKKIIGFSSTEQNGNIQEMTIYYSCLKNTNCSISVMP